MTERRADDATRDVQAWLKCYYMQDKIGEVFDGTVAGVTSFGLFIALDGIYVEGLLHVTELGNDYFNYDKARHEMAGERTGVRYRLGDRLRVKVARVDLETSKIDFVLVAATTKLGKDESAPVTAEKRPAPEWAPRGKPRAAKAFGDKPSGDAARGKSGKAPSKEHAPSKAAKKPVAGKSTTRKGNKRK
jgi:ribonuclease R